MPTSVTAKLREYTTPVKKALVHVIDQDAHGERHEQRQANLGRVDLTERLQDGVLKKSLVLMV